MRSFARPAAPAFSRAAPAARPSFATRPSFSRPAFARPAFSHPSFTRSGGARTFARSAPSRAIAPRAFYANRAISRRAFTASTFSRTARPGFTARRSFARYGTTRAVRRAAIARTQGGLARRAAVRGFAPATTGSLGLRRAARRGVAGAAIATGTIGGVFAARQAAHSGWFHRWRRHRIAFGWYGPVFWPYAYDTIFRDAFWPYYYAGDYFPYWDYGYGDIFSSLFYPYSYDELLTYEEPTVTYRRGRRRVATAPSRTATDTTAAINRLAPLCGDDSRDIAGVPVDEIQTAVSPTDAQRAALDELGNASVKAAQIIKAACPSDIALTPGGRLDAMAKRIAAMVEAVATVRPALDKFYDQLSDEQKARFNAIGATTDKPSDSRSLTQSCGIAEATDWPAAQIEARVHPTAAQRESLDALKSTMDQARADLKAACPGDMPATPPARLAAIATRLDAMAAAIAKVRAPLDRFYGMLSDEQKAQFNAIGRARARQG
jgi:hypothetical protein